MGQFHTLKPAFAAGTEPTPIESLAVIHILIALILLGVLLYLIQMIPMDATIMQLIRIVVIVGAILYVLSALGMWHGRF